MTRLAISLCLLSFATWLGGCAMPAGPALEMVKYSNEGRWVGSTLPLTAAASVVEVTGIPAADAGMDRQHALDALSRFMGPRTLPRFNPLSVVLLFDHVDDTGIYWRRFRAVKDSQKVTFGHTQFYEGHYEPLTPKLFVPWASVTRILRESVADSDILWLSSNESSELAIPISSISLPPNTFLFFPDSDQKIIELDRDSPNMQDEDKLVAALMTVCKHAGGPFNNTAGGKEGRICFYRDNEMEGSRAPIDISINGRFMARSIGGPSHLYLDLPQGDYRIGWHVDYSTAGSKAGSLGRPAGHDFQQATTLHVADGKTRYLRIRVHFGLVSPQIKISAANASQANDSIAKSRTNPLFFGMEQ